MGDRLRTGKPPRRGTGHPGLLSLSLPSVQAGMSTWRKRGVNRHIAWHQPVHVVSQCSLMPGWWLASGDQRQLTGNGSALKTCLWRCAIQIASFTYLLTYLLLHWSYYTNCLSVAWDSRLCSTYGCWPENVLGDVKSPIHLSWHARNMRIPNGRLTQTAHANNLPCFTTRPRGVAAVVRCPWRHCKWYSNRPQQT